jgi:hypothetical protein
MENGITDHCNSTVVLVQTFASSFDSKMTHLTPKQIKNNFQKTKSNLESARYVLSTVRVPVLSSIQIANTTSREPSSRPYALLVD